MYCGSDLLRGPDTGAGESRVSEMGCVLVRNRLQEAEGRQAASQHVARGDTPDTHTGLLLPFSGWGLSTSQVTISEWVVHVAQLCYRTGSTNSVTLSSLFKLGPIRRKAVMDRIMVLLHSLAKLFINQAQGSEDR